MIIKLYVQCNDAVLRNTRCLTKYIPSISQLHVILIYLSVHLFYLSTSSTTHILSHSAFYFVISVISPFFKASHFI
jgi:hypothetical protein